MKYSIDNHRIASVKAQKELFNLNSEYKAFINLSEKYKKAMEAGNLEEAERIANQHTELQNIHSLTLASGDYNEKIAERALKVGLKGIAITDHDNFRIDFGYYFE